MPLTNVFQQMAIRLNPQAAEDVTLSINLNFSDLQEHWLLHIHNSVLHGFANRQQAEANASLRIDSLQFKRLMLGLTDSASLLAENALEVTGDPAALAQLADMFDTFPRRFPIMTPRPQ